MFERPALIRDEVYGHLRDLIVRGELTPGEKLAEIDLCARLGVSRTPIREAIQRLVQEGLLDASANRGVRVRRVTAQEARDAYRVRETLDGLAAELAAHHHTPEDARDLQTALGTLDAAPDDYRTQTQLDLAYHAVITRAARNPVLADLARTLEHRVALIKHQTRTYNAHPDTRTQHHAILDAILARDGQRARDAAQAHVRTFAALALHDLEHPDAAQETPNV
ncbi:GntR family transcriptional regulator [Deinococcus maricopensis]|uniref:Transcriptional regulator, GntR family n=1 Tax=Deinococcus maricopensis (strain DSM 21211 / LMG 22137 / NRRL B-23946 / LB-34) TaxID=709986 RepID=E8U7H5_DEIML|nr:GntR family transcriptional regulator [Deinococcus maricopensis]ADV67014.1 transcriptional regulator, GntR family [Deinococcus maricopensis DSM 21211]